MFIGRTDAKAETPVLWPPDTKNWLFGKDPDAGKDWRQEKGMTEDEMSSLTQWTWVWVNSGSWWWTGRPGMLQSMGWQRVRHAWVTELNWWEIIISFLNMRELYLFIFSLQVGRFSILKGERKLLKHHFKIWVSRNVVWDLVNLCNNEMGKLLMKPIIDTGRLKT